MPVYNHPGSITLGQGVDAHAALTVKGLLLPLEVSVPAALAAALTDKSLPIPAPASGVGLIDTGASCTAIDESILIGLGLQPVGQIHTSGQSGAKLQNRYLAEVSFPGTPIPKLNLDVIGVQILDQGLYGLIGRDLLRACVLIYNGPQGTFSLAF